MKKMQVLSLTLLTFAIAVVFPWFLVYGSGQVQVYFDNTVDSYQIKKSVIWTVIISFMIILVLAQITVLINVRRRKDAENSLAGSEEILKTLINGTPDMIFYKNELQESEETYKALVELCPDAIFLNVDMKIVFSNMAGVKILGANCKEDIYQRNILDFVHTGTKALTKQYFNDIINDKEKQFAYEHKLKQFDGNSIDIETVFSIIPYKGKNAVMCVVRDITERKRNEEIKHKMDENLKLVRETLEYDKIKTEFFANLSHEVKTPLNIIIGTLQLLELALHDKHTRFITIMKQNCFRLLRLLNNLIYITEIDSGFVDVHFQNHDLVQIVKNIISAASRFIANKEIQLELDIKSDSLETACDAEKIERVILNLLSNAVKFTEKGGKIRISLYNSNDYAIISVKDTGIGIPDDMKEVIFQKFRQVDKSFTRKCEGSGIGLSLVKALVEMHMGSIEVKSEYSKGSEFIVKLPLWLMNSDEIAATASETASVCMDMVNIEFSDIY